MSLLHTYWETTHEGHHIRVHRYELTKGFSLSWDGVVIAQRRWSWIGLGTLEGIAHVDGRSVEVRAELGWGGWKGSCSVTVDGTPIAMRRVG